MRIWKYPLLGTEEQRIKMPMGARVIHAGLDAQGNPSVWAKVSAAEKNMFPIEVRVVGTGDEYAMGNDFRHVGSFVDSFFVWHVFVNDGGQ